MIFFTVETNTSFTVGEAVEKSGSTIATHSTGDVLGVVMASNEITENTLYQIKIYSAGGGGTDMILGADWDGSPGRFQFINGRIHPVSSGGDGWFLPELPQATKVAGDIVKGAIYA
tara:strand:+ start:455 stop:802 length:348 start_codon:yes stop_codon:yes gene_type:complete